MRADSARSYSGVKVDGVIHDRVVRKKRPITVNGQRLWVKPQFVRLKVHRLPSRPKIKVKSGTQTIDRAWRSLKSGVRNANLRPNSDKPRMRIRASQHRCWNAGKCQRKGIGVVLAD